MLKKMRQSKLRFIIGAIALLASGCSWLNTDVHQIASGAMAPTLAIGTPAKVNKQAYRDQLPERGDIVALKSPAALVEAVGADDGVFIYRVIGLPGEMVEVRDGQTWINQVPLSEPYIQEPADYTFGPATVPSEAYFVLGDNRNQAFDSSHWGFLPHAKLIGQVDTSE